MVTVLDDPSLHRYVGGEPLGFHELERRYERQSRGRSEDESERWFNWIIRDRTSQEAVGYVQATVEVETRVANVAWVVGSRYRHAATLERRLGRCSPGSTATGDSRHGSDPSTEPGLGDRRRRARTATYANER
jgi:hypothetical protein